MVTIESITEKLGFNPLTYDYVPPDIDYEDDDIPNPLSGLTIEELECIMQAAKNDPNCWKR